MQFLLDIHDRGTLVKVALLRLYNMMYKYNVLFSASGYQYHITMDT